MRSITLIICSGITSIVMLLMTIMTITKAICCLSFEEIFTPDHWDLLHIRNLIKLGQVNAILTANNFVHQVHHQSSATKAEFTHDVAKELTSLNMYLLLKFLMLTSNKGS